MLCRENGATAAYTPMLHGRIFSESQKYRDEFFTTCPQDRCCPVPPRGPSGLDTVTEAAYYLPHLHAWLWANQINIENELCLVFRDRRKGLGHTVMAENEMNLTETSKQACVCVAGRSSLNSAATTQVSCCQLRRTYRTSATPSTSTLDGGHLCVRDAACAQPQHAC